MINNVHILSANLLITSAATEHVLLEECAYSLEGYSSLDKLILLEKVLTDMTNNIIMPTHNRMSETRAYRIIKTMLNNMYIQAGIISNNVSIVSFELVLLNSNLHLSVNTRGV